MRRRFAPPSTGGSHSAASSDGQEPGIKTSWRSFLPDLLPAALLLVFSVIARSYGLPSDGLWHDDAVPGASLTWSPDGLIETGTDHPGYIALLTIWDAIAGAGSESLVYPTLIAGVIGAPLLYVALRACGYERSISFLLGAALVGAQTHIVYSGRVKPYTIDLLIVLAVAVCIPRLVRMHWRPWTALAWLAVVAIVAPFSGFALLALAVAGVIIVAHPAGDFPIRVGAVAVQAAGSFALVSRAGETYDRDELAQTWQQIWDAFPSYDGSPLNAIDEAFVHLRRVAEAFPGGAAWLAATVVVVVLLGLILASRRGYEAPRARFLLVLLLVALAAGFDGSLPFGPEQINAVSDGGRVSLWLVPVLAVGIAAVLHAMRSRLPKRRAVVTGFDGAVALAALSILVVTVVGSQQPYPYPGAESAAKYVEDNLGEMDALLVGYHAHWALATESNFEFENVPTPDSTTSFRPRFEDARIHYLDVGLQAESSLGPMPVGPRQVSKEVDDAQRVFVYYAMPEVEQPEIGARERLDSTLTELGFSNVVNEAFGEATVQVWEPGSLNISEPDLPETWTIIQQATAPLTGIALACAGGSTAGMSADLVLATSEDSALTITSEVVAWDNAASARAAFAAVAARGGECLREAPELAGLRVTTSRVQSPQGLGTAARSMRYLFRQSPDVDAPVRGELVLIVNGESTALINVINEAGGAPGSSVTSKAIEAVAKRLG